MKKGLVSLVALFSVLLATIPAFANIEFQIANNSGRTFHEIWVGPSSNTKWLDRDKVIRDGEPLRNGRYTTITLSSVGRENVRLWDLRVDASDGKKHEWHEIDLSGIYQIEIDRNWKANFQR